MMGIRRAAGAIILAALLGACSGGDKTPTQTGGPWPSLADVFMPNVSVYSPYETDIALAGTVRFNFPADEHNVAFRNRVAGTPADIGITKSSVVSLVFGTAGSFPYYCTLHPQMTGLVVVH